MLEAGADPQGHGFAAPGQAALAHAAYFGNPAVAEVLAAGGAPITTLAEAAGNGHLIDPHAIADADETQRVQALRAAAVCQHLKVSTVCSAQGCPSTPTSIMARPRCTSLRSEAGPRLCGISCSAAQTRPGATAHTRDAAGVRPVPPS